jgi:hypothetical protein
MTNFDGQPAFVGHPVTSCPEMSLCFHGRPGFSGQAGRISPGSQAEGSGKPGVLQLDHAFKPALE